MIKRHNIVSLLFGLMFAFILYKSTYPIPVFRFFVPIFSLFLMATSYYNYLYLKNLQKNNIWPVIRMALLLSAGFLIYFVLLDSFTRFVFLLVSVIIITCFEALIDKFAENILFNEIIIVSFGLFFGFCGLVWNFPTFTYAFLIGLFVSLLLLTRGFFEFAPIPVFAKWLNALILAFLNVQIYWACQFLPFHYSALSVIVFNIYYSSVILDYYFLFNHLTDKKVKFHLALSAICVGLVLLATPWRMQM